MKTILVPTDYSETAANALRYAAGLAAYAEARLVLVHVYHIPVPTSEVPLVALAPESLEKDNRERIALAEGEAKRMAGERVPVSSIVKSGFAVDEIIETAEEQEADVIVMGVTGMSPLGEALIGSVTTSVMKKTPIPVMVVPSGASFKKPEKLVFACNYEEKMGKHVTDTVKKFARLFGAKVMVLDVVRKAEVASYEKAVAGIELETSFGDLEHHLYFPEGDDVTGEINSFVDRQNAGLLVMAPQSHRSLAGIFHRSNTKKMAFHTHVPLLSIHN